MYSWSEHKNEDIWNRGRFDTIEACIEEAKRCGLKFGDTIYIGECSDVEIGGVDLSRVLEETEENVYEQVGEVSEGWDISSITEKRRGIYEVYEERLAGLVREYIEEIGETPTFYHIGNIREIKIQEMEKHEKD